MLTLETSSHWKRRTLKKIGWHLKWVNACCGYHSTSLFLTLSADKQLHIWDSSNPKTSKLHCWGNSLTQNNPATADHTEVSGTAMQHVDQGYYRHEFW